MKQHQIKTRELTLLAMLTAILFVQETVLSWIPNVQLSVFLVMVYGATLGLPKASAVITLHVLLDNMLWGSFSPVTTLPMWLGWLTVTFIGYLLRKAPLAAIVGGAVAGSLLYCWWFVPFNYLFLNIHPIAYLGADLVFEIILCCSSVLTVMFCYRPAERLILGYYKKYIFSKE